MQIYLGWRAKLKYNVQVKEVENQWGGQGENAESVTEFGARLSGMRTK